MENGALYSIVKSKCPRCNKGDLWIKKNTYSLGFDKMHERCSNCNLKYDLEQGFWYGAMYISYALGVALTVSVVVALTVLTDLEIIEKAVYSMLALVVLMPPIFRYSRNIWLTIFVRYDQKGKNSNDKAQQDTNQAEKN